MESVEIETNATKNDNTAVVPENASKAESNSEVSSDSRKEKVNGDEKKSAVPEMSETVKSMLSSIDGSLWKRGSEEKTRKKDEKNLEQMLRSLKPDEKLSFVSKKYLENLQEHRKLEQNYKAVDRKNNTLIRYCEQLENDKQRQIMINSRLESLCRELQKQHRKLKDESSQRIHEVSHKLQMKLNELSAMMAQTNESNMKLKDDNVSMTEKFKTLCLQMKEREEQLETTIEDLKLQNKLTDATLRQCSEEMAATEQLRKKEKEALTSELDFYKSQCAELEISTKNLGSQIAVYREKYEDFHGALAKSNYMYGGFKADMEKMSKKVQQVEKESGVWKEKWERAHKALLEMCHERATIEQEYGTKQREIDRLKTLCRTIQAERIKLYDLLESLGHPRSSIDIGSIPSKECREIENEEASTRESTVSSSVPKKEQVSKKQAQNKRKNARRKNGKSLSSDKEDPSKNGDRMHEILKQNLASLEDMSVLKKLEAANVPTEALKYVPKSETQQTTPNILSSVPRNVPMSKEHLLEIMKKELDMLNNKLKEAKLQEKSLEAEMDMNNEEVKEVVE